MKKKELKEFGIDIGPNKMFVDKNKFTFSFDEESNKATSELLAHDSGLIVYSSELLSKIIFEWNSISHGFSMARNSNKLSKKLDSDSIWKTSIKIYGDSSKILFPADRKYDYRKITEKSNYL